MTLISTPTGITAAKALWIKVNKVLTKKSDKLTHKSTTRNLLSICDSFQQLFEFVTVFGRPEKDALRAAAALAPQTFDKRYVYHGLIGTPRQLRSVAGGAFTEGASRR